MHEGKEGCGGEEGGREEGKRRQIQDGKEEEVQESKLASFLISLLLRAANPI